MNNDSPIIVVCTDRCGHLRHSCQRLAAVAAVATRCKASTKKSIFFRNKPIGTFFEGSLRGRKICFMLLIAYGYSQKRWIKYAIQLLQTCSEMEKEWQTKKVIPSTCTPFLFWAVVYIICAKTGQGDRAEAYPNQLSLSSNNASKIYFSHSLCRGFGALLAIPAGSSLLYLGGRSGNAVSKIPNKLFKTSFVLYLLNTMLEWEWNRA